MSQHDLAKLIGVSYQQAHKYEISMNRISAGRLSSIAWALGVDEGYFFEEMASTVEATSAPEHQPTRGLAENFLMLSSRPHQEAVCTLARALAGRPDETGMREAGAEAAR